MIGTTIGNYRIVERLGDGGMGAVFRAVDEMLDRDVAIKVLRPELARQSALIERFRQEAIALARLNHPRIAMLHGLERSGDNFLMVMEFVRGETLEAIVQRSGRLPWRRAAELMAAVLDALDHAHDRGVVHRDIKPANIMLAHSGTVKVMDFGIARVLGKSRQTQFGHAVGTPTYMAPEQLRGEDVDGRTDLYAVGAVLFELITGRMAFEADSDYSLMMKQLNEPPPPARSLVPDVPEAIDEVIQRAMRKQRDERFPDASAFRLALERVTSGGQPATPAASAPPTRFVASEPAAPRRATADSPAPAETRLAGENAVAQTRLAAESPVAETRLAFGDPTPVPSAQRHRSPDDGDAIVPLHRDWRTYLTAAAVLVAIGVGIRAFSGAPDGRVAADRATPVVEAPAQPPPLDPARAEGQADAARPIVVPQRGAAVAEPVPGPVAIRPAPPPSSGPPAGGSGGKKGRAVPPPATESRPEPKPDTVAVVPAPPGATKAPERAENDETSAEGVPDALQAFAGGVREKRAEAGSALAADGAIAAKWAELIREGRLTMRLEGAPEVDARGGRATARFNASLTVRSPFGGTKERKARFQAQLARSGGTWRVVSLSPLGGLDLR